MDEESKEIFSNSVTLRDAGADLQEDDFPQLLAVQQGGLTNEDLRELRREREEGERQEEEELKDLRESAYRKRQRVFSAGGVTVLVCSSRSECNPGLLCHL